MNPPNSDSATSNDAIETAAAEWLCEREEGFAPGRARAFAAWRAADQRHEAMVAETERAMGLLAEMPAVRASLEAHTAAVVPAVVPGVRWVGFRLPVWASGLAAAFVLAAGVWFFMRARPAESQHYVTAAAQQQFALKDGSVVNLNVSSEVNIRLTSDERRVTLTSGEAHFAVAHDAERPFIVTAAGVSVRAVGTAFSVRVGDAGVEVLVTEGKVEVTRDCASVGVAAVASPAVVPARLVAGERAVIAREAPVESARIERVSAEVLSATVRWHSHVMTFSDLPLREAIALFNRRNEMQLVLVDEKLGDQKIGGTFAIDQVGAFVRLLEKDGDVVAEQRGPRDITLRRAP